MRLQSKAAVVTGAATGIGQAIATAFAQEGACSAVDSVGKPATADETMRRITADGGCSIAIAADVSNLSQVQTSIDKTVSHLGRIDIVVNNAGMEFKKPFLDYPLELWQKIPGREPDRPVVLRASGRAANA